MPATPDLRKREGFTLTEMMVSTFILFLAIAGALAMYLAYQRAWVTTTLARDTSSKASVALERMVYGIGTNNGLRAAREDSVTLVQNGKGWTLSFNDGSLFQYQPATRMILTENADIVADKVIDSSAVLTNRGVMIGVEVVESGGGRAATNRMSSFVQFRN